MKIRKQNVRDNDGEIYEQLTDTDTGTHYRRILCGLGWPIADKPGFVIVVAEGWDQDFSIEFSPHHLWLLDEHESDGIEELYRTCLKFQSVYLFRNVLGNNDNTLHHLWCPNKKGVTRLNLRLPYDFDNITLDFVAQLMKKNTAKTRKILHFGHSVLPGHLDALLPDNVETEKLESSPPIAALGFVLSEMERTRAIKVNRRKRVKYYGCGNGWMSA